jgi:hypothetical protein
LVLEATTYEAVCCRHVSHLTTASGDEIQVGEVTVFPEREQWGGLVQRIQREISARRRLGIATTPAPTIRPTPC